MKIFSFLIFFFISFQVLSQSEDIQLLPELFAPIIYPVEANARLVNKEINELAQDEQGFIWLGTRQGLFRYDGHEYKKIHFSSDDFDFDNIYVRALMVDKNTLWIGSMSDGMFALDLITYQVTQFLHDNRVNSISGNQVNDFAMTASGDFWIATSFGLDKFNKKSQKFGHYRSAENTDDRYFNYLLDIELDSRKQLWIATANGLAKYSEKNKSFKRTFLDSQLANVSVRKIFLAKDNRLWLATQKKGSFIVSANGDQLTPLPVENSSSLKINTAITQPNEEEIWIGGTKGVEIRHAVSGKLIKVLKANKQDAYSLNRTTVYAMLTDKSGLTWLGVRNEGLRFYNANNKGILRLDNYHKALSPYFDSSVDGVMRFSANEILILKEDKSVKVNLSTGHVTELQYNEQDIFTKFPAVIKLDDKRIILGSNKGELFYYTLDTGLFEKINVTFNNPLEEPISQFALTKDNKLWFSKTNHLFRLDLENGQLIQATKSNNELFQSFIRTIKVDSENRLWLSTISGVGLIESGERQVTIYSKERGTQGSLSSNYINHIVENKQGDIFINTSSGINRLKEKTNNELLFEPFAKAATDEDSKTKKLYFFKDNSAWFGPNFRLNSQGEVINKLTIADGILPHGRGKSIFALNSRQLLFSYSNQIDILEPDALNAWTFTPKIAVTELMIDNKQLTIGNHLNEITLSADNSSFSLRFSALDLSSLKNNRYRYRLKGLDDSWQETPTDIRQLKYNSLSPGVYYLHLDASDRRGQWLNSPFVIKVTVYPKYYQTLWFRLMLISSLVFVIYLLFQWRLAKVKNVEREAHEKREAIQKAEMMSQLMDQKNKMFADVTHDLRTPLTNIKMQLEALEDGALEPNEKSYSSLQKKLGNLNHMIGDLYQLSLVESGSLVLNKEDILIESIVTESIESFQPLANKAGLSITYQSSTKENILVNADSRRLLQAFNNLLKNSIRYTDPLGKINVSISVEFSEVIISFEDTSPGVLDKDLNNLFNRLFRVETTKNRSKSGSGLGLSIVNSIINAHGGTVSAEHSSLGGLNIVVKLPKINL
ncbi:MAG: hypothetical protein JKY19_09190 [Alcanivoracaceae bacterium]|nr:hypothetical protein [Alcanivoracaceae bacterium]